MCSQQGLSGLQSLTHCTQQQNKGTAGSSQSQVAVRDIGRGNLSRSRILDGNYHNIEVVGRAAFWHVEIVCNRARKIAMPATD